MYNFNLKKMAYLITCSGSKKTPDNEQVGSLEELFCHKSLGDHRQNLINQSEIQLDWTKTLPAYDLYSGRRSKIYKHVSIQNWEKDCVDILILSALFGWIRHTDLIPEYDLSMNQITGNIFDVSAM